MKYVLLLLITLPLLSQAQNHSDSVSYYERQMADMLGKVTDSIVKSDTYKQARERKDYHASKSDGYRSFMIFGEVADVNFGNFNKTIVANGFQPMDGPMYRLGLGMSTKHDRGIVDFTFVSSAFRKKSKRGDETISTNFSNALQFDFGYDLTQSTLINVYPYLGASVRTSSIKYKKPGQTNPNYTDVSNILLNETEVNESSTKFGYQAGVGFDFVLRRNHIREGDKIYRSYRTAGTIFFIKAGTSGVIGKETYKIGSVKYRPGIDYGRWIVTFGFKFFGRE